MTEKTGPAEQTWQRPKIKNPEFVNQLKSRQIVSGELIGELLEELNQNALDLLTTLIQSGYGSKRKLCQIWCDSIGIAHVDLQKTLFQPDLVRRLPEAFARRNYAIPVYRMGEAITVATAVPQSEKMRKALEERIGEPVNLVFALPSDIEWAIKEQYHTPGTLHDFLEKISASRALSEQAPITRTRLEQTAGGEAIGQLHVAIILYAIKENAGSVRIEPREKQEGQAAVILSGSAGERNAFTLAAPVYQAVSRNLKKLARLGEKTETSAVNGRILFPTPGKKYDIRFFVRESAAGPEISLTLMGRAPLARLPQITDLYMAKPLQDFIVRQLHEAKGIFLLAGPEPSENAPVAYAMLKEDDGHSGQRVTLEDEIRYLLSGIQQQQVNPQAGFSREALLTASLELNPGILYIERIDDGALVRQIPSTEALAESKSNPPFIIGGIYGENSFHALSRAYQLGILNSVSGILARQPAERLCDHCKQEYNLPEEIRSQLFIDSETREVPAWRAQGCPYCGHTGFFGKIGVYEFIAPTPGVRQLIEQQAPASELHQAAAETDYESLAYDGVKKLIRGLIPLEELERITGRVPD